jgi:hypothetical protein
MCKKCGYPLKETKDISVSVRIHKFGRQVTALHVRCFTFTSEVGSECSLTSRDTERGSSATST